jgi:hypothetical protein
MNMPPTFKMSWSKPVGYYALGKCGEIRFMLSFKPSWFHRFWMKHLLDFYWVDLEDEVHGA